MGIHNGDKIAAQSGAGLVDLLGQQPGPAHIAGGAAQLGCRSVNFIDRRERARSRAAAEGISLSALARRALERYLAS